MIRTHLVAGFVVLMYILGLCFCFLRIEKAWKKIERNKVRGIVAALILLLYGLLYVILSLRR